MHPMNDDVLVSVVMPIFNAEPYLRAAVLSLLQQTHRELDVVLVDDGSTDGSAVIASELARSDPRIRVIGLTKSGLSAALNVGIATARGNYVARMDADDVAHPQRIEKQLAYLQSHPSCVLVGSAMEVIDAEGESLGTRYFAESHQEIVEQMLRGLFTVSHPTVLVRRDALIAAGGYDASLYPCDDYALWLELSHYGELANLREPLLQYRRHERSVSVVNRVAHHALTIGITNAARTARGLPPLRNRTARGPNDIGARYHFDCARFALTGGSRFVAIRHLLTVIFRAPFWLEPYAVLGASLLPRPLLFLALEVRSRWRARIHPLPDSTATEILTAEEPVTEG